MAGNSSSFPVPRPLISAAMLAVIVAQPIGRLVQKYITPRPDLQGVEVVGTRPIFGGLKKVDTRAASS